MLVAPRAEECRFFALIERIGIQPGKMADHMKMSRMHYWRVASGRNVMSLAFINAAVNALSEIGIRKEDGTAYTAQELFFDGLQQTAARDTMPLIGAHTK